MFDPHGRFAEVAGRVVHAAGLDPARAADVRDEVIGHLLESWEARVAQGDQPALAADRAIEEFGSPGRVALRFYLRRVAADIRAAATVPRLLAGVLTLDVIGSLLVILFNAPADWLSAEGRAPFMGVVFGGGIAVYFGVAITARLAITSLRRARGDGVNGVRVSRFELLAASGLLVLGVAVWYGLLPSLTTSLVRRVIEPHYLRTSTTLWVILASCAAVVLGYGATLARVRAASSRGFPAPVGRSPLR